MRHAPRVALIGIGLHLRYGHRRLQPFNPGSLPPASGTLPWAFPCRSTDPHAYQRSPLYIGCRVLFVWTPATPSACIGHLLRGFPLPIYGFARIPATVSLRPMSRSFRLESVTTPRGPKTTTAFLRRHLVLRRRLVWESCSQWYGRVPGW